MLRHLKLSILPLVLSSSLYSYDYVQIQVQDLLDLATYKTVFQYSIPLYQDGDQSFSVKLRNDYELNLQFSAKNIFSDKKNAYKIESYLVKNKKSITKDVDFSVILDNDKDGMTQASERGYAPRLPDVFFRHYYRLCLKNAGDNSPCMAD